MSLGKRKSLCLESDPHDKPLYSRASKLTKKRRTEDYTEALGEQKAGAKMKRQVWTSTSIDAFFEGLCQHGKCFHGILHYMQAKFKKKNDPTIPNLTKDQVRFFYYRTWHKVSIMLSECSTEESNRKQLKLGCEESSPPPLEKKCLEQEDIENPLDFSMEEGDGELSPRPSSPIALPETNSLEPSSVFCAEVSDKEKENAPNTVPVIGAVPDDKLEVKKEVTKDTVMVNGKNHSLDLVALICYHKLRKKCPEQVINRKLRELVYQGYTTIREKGKRKLQYDLLHVTSLMVKIPNCRALRGNLNTIDIPPPADGTYSEPEPLTPSEEQRHIVIELRPLSMMSWLYVQGLAQNPRVRLIVTASKPVSEILHYLALKWHLKAEDLIQLYHAYDAELAAPETISTLTVQMPHENDNENGSVPEKKGCAATTSTESLSDAQKELCDDKLVLIPLTRQSSKFACNGNDLLDGVPRTGKTVPPQCLAQECVPPLTDVREATLLEPPSECTVEHLHCKFSKPMKLKLFYECSNREYTASETSCNPMLATMCRMVEFVIRHEENKGKTGLVTPVSLDCTVQSSPNHVGLTKMLPKRSPWKSPLSKYQRLKTGSPLKQGSMRRTRLNFSIASGAYSSKGKPETLSAVVPASPAVVPVSPNPPNLSILSCDPQTPEPVPATNPNWHQPVGSVSPCCSGEAFSNIKLSATVLSGEVPGHQDAAAAATAAGNSNLETGSSRSLDNIHIHRVPQPQTAQLLEKDRAPAVSLLGDEALGTTGPSTPLYQISISGHSRVFVSPLTVDSSKEVLPKEGCRTSPKGHGVLVQPLNRTSESSTYISQSPLLQFASSSLGASFSEKNSAHAAATDQLHVPVMSSLKPFSKPKRVKKAAGKSLSTRQLVPRPLSFLSNSSLGSVQSEKVVDRDTVPPANPPPSSQPSNPMQAVPNQNSSNVSQMLALLQSLLQQQVHNISNTANSSRQPLQSSGLPKQQVTLPESSTNANTDTITTSLPGCINKDSVIAFPDDIDKDLPVAPIETIILPSDKTSGSEEILNTSDTVNELLQGLCSHSNDNSLQKLSEETADVLPTFAKAMMSLETTPPSTSAFKPSNLSQDPSLGGNMDQGELLELAEVFSQLKEALQTPEKSRQHIADGDASLSELLNLGDSQDRKTENPLNVSGDSVYKSLLDDGSVDYIQKFRDLASKMNQSS